MGERAIEEVLRELHEFCGARNLSKGEVARQLGIPYETFRKWFAEGEKRVPSSIHAEKIEEFLKHTKDADTRWRELWAKILNWWETQHRYSSLQQLAEEVGWDALSLQSCFQNKTTPPKLVVERISGMVGLQVPILAQVLQEAERKTERVKQLLLLLEEDLRWFRDGGKEARDVLRATLDAGDVGYISSLLGMLGDEEKFERWRALTSHRFNCFRKERR